MRCLVVGNQPPPFGGVAVYVRRRISQLVAANVVVFVVPSAPRLAQLARFLVECAFLRLDLVEVNSTRIQWVFFLRALFPRATIIVIDHNSSRRLGGFGGILNAIYGLGFLLVDRIDIVRMGLELNYRKLPFYSQFKFSARSVYITPPESEIASAIQSWPDSFASFVAAGRVIVSCAYELDFQRDIYRYFDILHAFVDVARQISDVKLVLTVARCQAEYAARLNSIVEAERLQARVFFLVGPVEIWPLFKSAQLFLRITTTDGDSVAVREALAFGCGVVASNVVARPEGVVLVSLGDTEGLTRAIMKRLNE
jgi:glycosyltransferase involved in cell wall biosynthesis